MSELVLTTGITPIKAGDLPPEWRAKQLNDICTFYQGGRLGLTKQDHYRPSGFPAFSAAGQDGFVQVAEFLGTEAVVLSAIGANCGRCFFASGDWTTLANVQAIIPNPSEANARFLHYRIDRDSYWPRSGSAQPFIKPSEIRSCWVALPPISQQSVIVQVLNMLDTTICETEAIIAKLKAVKQGLLHDLLTCGIDANGELRPPQSEAPHLYKPSPLGWIPKEWSYALLDEIATRGSGHTPSKSVPSYWNGGVKWVSLADSHRLDKIYIKDTDKEISALGIANSSAVLHPGGTVILSRDAGIGKSAVLAAEMAVSQHFMTWRCGETLDNLYLYFHLQREKPRFEAIAIGSTIQTIGLQFFKMYSIQAPPLPEQKMIVAILMNAEGQLTENMSHLSKLNMYKSALMDDLLTGRVRVTPLLETADA
jgi:type I restriction enzyme S subunit